MPSSKDYLDYIIDQLKELDSITYRPMMGEYLLYYQGTLFGGIYDNRLLVKIIDSNKSFNMVESLPYLGAKPMYLVDDLENKEILKKIILKTYQGLINQKNC